MMKNRNILTIFTMLFATVLLLAFSSTPAQAQVTLCSYGATGTVTANEAVTNIGVEFSLPAGAIYRDPFSSTNQVAQGGSIGQGWQNPDVVLASGQTGNVNAPIGLVQSNVPPTVTGIGSTNYPTFPYILGNVTSNVTLAGGCAVAATPATVEVVEVVAPAVIPIPQYRLVGNVQLDTLEGFVNTPANGSNLEIWVVDGNGNGVPGAVFTAEELAAFPTSPESNTELASGSGFAFYVLTTGEYQINYGPTADGWIDVVIFNRDFEVVNQSRFSIIPR